MVECRKEGENFVGGMINVLERFKYGYWCRVNEMLVVTILYGSRTHTLYEYDKSKSCGMDYLRHNCDVRKINHLRNEVLPNLCSVESTWMKEWRSVFLGGRIM